MADTRIVPAMHGLDQSQPTPWLKLVDNGDGTFSYSASLSGPVNLAGNSFRNISAAATTLIKSGAGTLLGVFFNKLVSLTTTTIYDSLTATGTKIGTVSNPLTLLNAQAILPYNVAFSTGLTIVTSGGDDITVVYR